MGSEKGVNGWQIGGGSLFRGGLATALIAGAFAAAVGWMLWAGYVRGKVADPLDSPRYRELKAALALQPKDAALKEQVRALDLQLRAEYFQRLDRIDRVRYLLAGGVIVFFLGAGLAAAAKRRLPMPGKAAGEGKPHRLAHRLSQAAVAVFAVAVGAGAGFWAFHASGQQSFVGMMSQPGPVAGVLATRPSTGPAAIEARFPTADEIARNWPRFRGPAGGGISAYANVPVSWDGPGGKNILWKTPVPLPGENSPVVWGNRVFVTGADKTKHEVYCFDGDTGKLLWQTPLPTAGGAAAPEVNDDAGYAPSTAATDGQRVYAIFPTGDLACLDYAGHIVWSRNLGQPDNPYGHASSLILCGKTLLVQYDHGAAEDKKSLLLALDCLSGREVWKSQPRPVGASWPTPLVINTPGGEQVVTCAKPWAIGYDAADGKELWRAEVLAGEVAPSPIYAGGKVLTVNAGAILAAINPAARGELGEPDVAKKFEDNLPDIASPLSDGERIWMATTAGMVTCVDFASGRKLWEKDLGPDYFRSSPSLAGDKLYLMNEKGVMFVLAAGGEFKEIARSQLGEGANTCPAFGDGRIYIRGKTNLFCIAEKKP